MNSRPLAFFSIVFFMLLLFGGSVLGQTNTFPSSGAAGIGTTTPDASVGLHTRFSGLKTHLRLDNPGKSEYSSWLNTTSEFQKVATHYFNEWSYPLYHTLAPATPGYNYYIYGR